MEVTALRDALGQHDEEHDSGVSPSPTRMVRLFGVRFCLENVGVKIIELQSPRQCYVSQGMAQLGGLTFRVVSLHPTSRHLSLPSSFIFWPSIPLIITAIAPF